MVDTLKIKKINHAHIKIECNQGIAYELGEEFSFFVENYKYMPTFRNGLWDGKIKLFDSRTKLLPSGLVSHLDDFDKKRNYKIDYVESAQYGNPNVTNDIPAKNIMEFIKTLKLTLGGKPIEIYDYQFNAVCHGLKNKNAVMISPTGSGKSLIQYVLARYYLSMLNDYKGSKKVLIIVPTTSLVEQMYDDFRDYGMLVENGCHRIYSGKDKDNITAGIVVSTWQSIYKLPKKWFEQFGMVIGDETHLFKAKSLSSIITKLTEAEYRIGVSGTLDGSLVNELVLQGHFGPIYKVTKTKELQKRKVLSNINISVLSLEYPPEIRKSLVKTEYQKEIDFIVTNKTRLKFVKNLAKSLKGNTLVLFQFVEKHGKPLHEQIKDSVDTQRKVFFVYGGVDAKDRELIRKIVETQSDAIIVASYQTFGTGINIKNIHNIILASPSKSQIRVLQSIGRGLRISDNKEPLQLYDICDDMHWGKYLNYALKHSVERCTIYDREEFPWKIYNIKL